VSQVLECKQLHARGQSVRAISKSLGVAGGTVRGYLCGDRLPGEYRIGEGRARPVSTAVEMRVREMLCTERAAKTPRKQLLTAARIGRYKFPIEQKAFDLYVRATGQTQPGAADYQPVVDA